MTSSAAVKASRSRDDVAAVPDEALVSIDMEFLRECEMKCPGARHSTVMDNATNPLHGVIPPDGTKVPAPVTHSHEQGSRSRYLCWVFDRDRSPLSAATGLFVDRGFGSTNGNRQHKQLAVEAVVCPLCVR